MSKASKKRKKALKRRRAVLRAVTALVSALLIVVVIFSIPGGERRQADPFTAAASELEDSGEIRVYLRSLGRPQALGITLDGAYTVEGDSGFRFSRGTEISVSADQGSLLLTCGGLTLDMGSSFSLTRHAVSDGKSENGMYIHESEKDTLFAGDLYLANEQNGIDLILTIGIEEYLYGVVAYEMSDSWPLEALKAQAVAARTYAMRAKKAAAGKAYDVVDTTADQVYKGYDPAYRNVKRAVDETRGVVGVYQGTYAGCYYTASNGGQVASGKQIWGGSGTEYIEMKDDPYDLENPLSVVKRASVPKAPAQDHPLCEPLAVELSEPLALMGFSDDADDIRIDRIHAIRTEDPDVEGSYMYSSFAFDVSVSAKKWVSADSVTPAEPLSRIATPSTPGEELMILTDFQPIEGILTVKLPTWRGVEALLALSINTTDIELFTVVENEEEFVIESRRFGHGVGMSQRGAQTMAGTHGMRYDEILSFYYPGMSIEKIEWDAPEMKTIEALPASVGLARPRPTPKPTPAPLPALKSGEYYARVKLESAASTLNVRQGPSTSNPIVGILSNNDRLIVVESAPDGWFKIKTVELSGYVKGDYIIKE